MYHSYNQSLAIKNLVFLFTVFLFLGLNSYGEDQPVKNPRLESKVQDLIKNSLKVDSESEGVVIISIDRQSYARGTEILFVRNRGTRVEMIATGKVATDQMFGKKRKLLVQLTRESVVKYPESGDLAVTLADPNSTALGNQNENKSFLKPVEETMDANREQGYLEFGMGLLRGSIASQPTTDANLDKNTSGYRFNLMHAAYYSHYYPIGIEYDAHSGKFPTRDYNLNTVASEESVSTIALVYRFRKIWNNKFRLVPKFVLLSDEFKTDNTDERLLTTTHSGMGLGLRASYEFQDALWIPTANESFVTLQRIYGDYNYFPIFSAKDSGLSRGTASTGSTASLMQFGATAILYLKFVPLIKRFIAEAGMSVRSYSLKFSGATTSENIGGGYLIPISGQAKESETDYHLFFGIRIEDPIAILFGKSKQEKK